MHSRFAAFRRILLAAALASGGSAAFAATNYTWEGIGTNASWNTTSNFTAHGTPTTTSVVTFTAANATNNSPVITSGAQVGELLFSSGGGGTFSGTNALTIAGVSGIGIDNATANLVTFNNPFALTASQTWETTGTGSMTFSPTANVTGPSGGTTTLTLQPNSGTTITFAGTIANGSGGNVLSLTESGGTGTVILTLGNTYSGATTISSGTLQLGNNTPAGTIANTSGITDNGTLAFDLSANASIAASITGTGGVTQMDTGIITLTGTNNYSGATVVNTGDTLDAGSTTAFGSGSAVTINGTGTLALNGNNVSVNSVAGTGSGTVSLGANTLTLTGGTVTSASFAGVVSGTNGSLTLNNSALTETLTGNNTYTGATTITAGTLQIGGSGNLGSGTYAGTITDNGTLQFSSSSTQTLSARSAARAP